MFDRHCIIVNQVFDTKLVSVERLLDTKGFLVWKGLLVARGLQFLTHRQFPFLFKAAKDEGIICIKSSKGCGVRRNLCAETLQVAKATGVYALRILTADFWPLHKALRSFDSCGATCVVGKGNIYFLSSFR